MKKYSSWVFIALASLLVFGQGFRNAAFGQGANASISGIVQDQSRALIPGVAVTVTNDDTGVKLNTVTNEAGAYGFPSLTPGKYSISASLPGFRTSTLRDLELGRVQVRQDFTLEVASAATSVEVTATADALLRESSASIGDVLTQERTQELPLVGNNVLDLLQVMPGMKLGNFTVVGAFNTDNYTGQYGNTVNVTRNGISVNSGRNDANIFGLQSTVNINPDLVGEIRLILSPVDPEFRGNAQIQVSTRSGTNRYTGSATWRVHNTALDSNTWANNHTSFTDPSSGQIRNSTPLNWSNRHNYTVSYGGPIIRNKTFFFASWDQQLNYSRNVVNATVFTDTARMGIYRYFQGWNPANPITVQTPITGNTATQVAPSVDILGRPIAPPNGAPLRCFSMFGNQRYDETANGLVPISTADASNFCPGGTFVYGPSAGGLWDPLRPTPDRTGYIRQLMSFMPKANAFNSGDGLNTASFSWIRRREGSTNGGNAAAGADPNNVARKQLTIKIDENLTQKHRVSAEWSIERTSSTDAVVNWPTGLFGESRTRPQTFTANATSTLSASLLNEFRFGWRYEWGNRVGAWESPDSRIRDEAAKWFLPGGTNSALGSYSPSAAGSLTYLAAINSGLGGIPGNGMIDSTFAGSGSSSPLWNFSDTVSYSRGRHSFKVGGEIRLSRSKGYAANSYPSVTLGPWGANTTPLAGTNQFADVLPGFLAQAAAGGGTAARTVAGNMLYFLTGSVATASTNYWINSAADATNGVWQDLFTTGKRYRSQIANDYSLFVKDDWKVTSRLTLNLGLRWEGYASPYIKEGFTSRIINQGVGLFGVHQPADPSDWMKDWLESPGRIYLSGYGSNATASAALACTKGTTNPNGLPASTCDPNLLTASEFVGPNTPNPDKSALPPAWKNFAPSVGFAWNVPWFGEGKTTMRGGFGMSFVTPGRNGSNLETVLGASPGSTISGTVNTSDPQYQPIIASGRLPNLADLPALVPVRPTRAPGLPLPITGRTFLSNTQAWLPDYELPYVMNANLSITRSLRRNMTLDVRYVGSFQRRRDITFDVNTFNVFYNKELFQALVDTRAGKDPALLDQMLAGLDLHGAAGAGYGPVGTVVNGVYQTGAAHLRRNATFTNNLANGNFVGVVNSLYNLSTTSNNSGPLQPLPAGVTGVGGRIQRNGCDRMANGYSYVQQTAPSTFATGFSAANATPLRCFPEDYMITNPQFTGFLGSGATSAMLHTNHGYNNYNALQTEFTLRPTQGTNFSAVWAFEKIMDFGAPYFNPTWFIDPKRPDDDYVVNWATTAHDFRVTGTFELPIGPNRLFFGNTGGWVARLLERWSVSIIQRNASGLPRDLYGAQMMFRSGGGDRPYPRPDIVGPWVEPELAPKWIGDNGWIYGSPDLYTNFRDPQCTNNVANGFIASNPDSGSGTGQFNFGASCTLTGLATIVPAGTAGANPVLDANGVATGRYAVNVLQNSMPGTQGNFPHSKMQLPRRQTLDANISKSFRMSESKTLQVRVDATNVLNHPNWNEPTLSIQSANFGRTTGKGGPGNRVLQAQVRLNF